MNFSSFLNKKMIKEKKPYELVTLSYQFRQKQENSKTSASKKKQKQKIFYIIFFNNKCTEEG